MLRGAAAVQVSRPPAAAGRAAPIRHTWVAGRLGPTGRYGCWLAGGRLELLPSARPCTVRAFTIFTAQRNRNKSFYSTRAAERLIATIAALESFVSLSLVIADYIRRRPEA